MSFFEILPDEIKEYLGRLPIDRVNEIRLRAAKPVVVCMNGRNLFLTKGGLCREPDLSAVTVSRTDIDAIVHKASNYSIYAVNDQLKQGFITVFDGVRIGICGTVVTNGDQVTTIKDISSLNIRIPHQVKNCAYPVLPYIFGDLGPVNTLVISPPGGGKTTLLRDLAVQICNHFPEKNLLVLDERGEIAANQLGENMLDVGATCDVITGSGKLFGFVNGIRSMRPDIIITDEVSGDQDCEMLRIAARSGVVVIASVHASGVDEISRKPHFADLVKEKIFDRLVVLSARENIGQIAGVFDANLKVVAIPN